MFDPDDLGALWAGEPISVYLGHFTVEYQISRYCGWLTNRGTFATDTDRCVYSNCKLVLDHLLKPNMRDRAKKTEILRASDFE